MKFQRILLLAAAFLLLGADTVLSAPGDVTFKRESSGTAFNPAVFPHWVHAIRYRCYVCHPKPFKMVKFKMEKGILKQDRGPYKDPNQKVETKAESAEENPEKQQTTSSTQDPGEQPAPAAVPVIPVETLDKSAEKTAKSSESVEETAKPGGADKVMHGEQACGLCHNGENAFLIEFKTCGKCHAE